MDEVKFNSRPMLVLLLSLAAITKYLLPAFIPAFLIYVILRHGIMKSTLFALAPLTVFMTLCSM